MNAKLVAAVFVWGLTVLSCVLSPLAAREVGSPGFEAAWAEVTEDGRLLYHCLVDLRNCDAEKLNLVVQFRHATKEDANVMERGSDQALMLFPQTWQRPAEASTDSPRWEPEAVEIEPRLFARADLEPGMHNIDAIFDLFDVDANKYVAGGWPWRLTLRVNVAVNGQADVAPYLPNDMFPLFRNPDQETTPPVVLRSAQIAGNEALPRELSAYEMKPLRLFGTMRLRHGADLAQVEFSKDGGTLISVGVDRSLCLWKSDRGTLKERLQGTVLKASDGAVLLLDTSETPTVLDPATGRSLCRVQDAPETFLAAGLSTDASRLVLLSEKSIGQWDMASGERVAQQAVSIDSQPQAEVTGSLSRCGRFAALACNAGKMNNVVVFEVSTGRKVLSTVIDYGVAPPVIVCADGTLLALPDPQRFGKHNLAIFDAATGESLRTFEIGYSRCPIAASPAGTVLAMVDDWCLIFYDPTTGEARRLPGLGAEALQLVFSPEGKYLVISGGHGVKIVEVATGQLVAQWHQPATTVAFSADGKRLVSGGRGGVLDVRDASAGTELLRAAGLGQPISGLAVSADGRSVAACSELGECRVWNLATGLPVFWVHAHQTRDASSAHVDLSPDGRRMVTGAPGGGDPLVWDVVQGRVVMPLPAGGVGADSVVFSPDGQYVAACHQAGDESSLCVWDLSTRQPVLRDRYLAQDATFSRDGNNLVAASHNEKSIVQYAWSERQPGKKVALTEAPENVACTGDGKLIACAGQILDAETGQLIAEHEELSTSAVKYLFAPDGLQLLAVADGQLHVFAPLTGKRLRTIAGPWRITAAAFTADGKTLLTGLCNGVVVAWQWQP